MTADAMFVGIEAFLSELGSCGAVKAGELELLERGVSIVKSSADMTREVSERFVKQVRPLLALGEVRMTNELLGAFSAGMCPITLCERNITPDVTRRLNAHLSLIDGSIPIA